MTYKHTLEGGGGGGIYGAKNECELELFIKLHQLIWTCLMMCLLC